MYLYYVRERVSYMYVCVPVDMIKHSFPLPPLVDAHCKNILAIVRTQQQTELMVTRCYNKEQIDLFEVLIKKQEVFAQCQSKLLSLHHDLSFYKSLKVIGKVTLYGRAGASFGWNLRFWNPLMMSSRLCSPYWTVVYCF